MGHACSSLNMSAIKSEGRGIISTWCTWVNHQHVGMQIACSPLPFPAVPTDKDHHLLYFLSHSFDFCSKITETQLQGWSSICHPCSACPFPPSLTPFSRFCPEMSRSTGQNPYCDTSASFVSSPPAQHQLPIHSYSVHTKRMWSAFPFWYSFYQRSPRLESLYWQSFSAKISSKIQRRKRTLELLETWSSRSLRVAFSWGVTESKPSSTKQLRIMEAKVTWKWESWIFYRKTKNKNTLLSLLLLICFYFFPLNVFVWIKKFFDHLLLGYILNLFVSAFCHER